MKPEKSEKPGKPMKPWKAVCFVCFLGFIGLVVAYALGGVGVTKRGESAKPATSSSVAKSSDNPLKGYATKPKKVEDSSSSSSSSTKESSSSKKPSSLSSSSETKGKESKTESGSSDLPQVNYPSIKSEDKSTAVVSAKKVYKKGDTLVFALELTLPTKELGTVTVEYFTSGVNYNTVKVGDLLSVEYGVSSDGSVALAVVNTI